MQPKIIMHAMRRIIADVRDVSSSHGRRLAADAFPA